MSLWVAPPQPQELATSEYLTWSLLLTYWVIFRQITDVWLQP